MIPTLPILPDTPAAQIPEWLRKTPIAHRGLHTPPNVPENSLGAFAAATRAGFAIELDVRLLQSGEAVVSHDADWFRMTGQSGFVRDTDASDIAAFCLAGTSERVPLLSDVLQAVSGQTPLLIELKIDSVLPVGATENAVLETLKSYAGPVALQSFHTPTVNYLRAHAPGAIPCGQLAVDDAWYNKENALPDFLGYMGYALPSPLTQAFRARGGLVLAWTLFDPSHVGLAAPHADNFIFENFIPNQL